MASPSQAVSGADDRNLHKGSGPARAPAAIDGQWVLQSILPLLFAVGLLYAIATATIGWGHTLNDRHSFRQSQTAMTAYFLIDQPLRLAYETPVLGKPWSIPMEFPLYQWIVARIVRLFGTPLDQTGRFVSLAFFLLTTIPLYRINRSLNVSAKYAWLPLLLFTISPFYIFWGRAFMIETTALFFSVCYLAAAMEAKKDSRWRFALVAITFGSVAALVKVTTFLVYFVFVATLFAASCWQQWCLEHDMPAMRARLLRLGAIVVVPFVVAVAWVMFADAVKAENPLAAAYLTSQTSSNWNYGTVEQKFSRSVWGVIVGRFPEYVGLPQLAWLLLGVTLAVTLVHRRRWKETAVCLAGWLLAPAIFTNVHFVHDYYANANAIFLIAAIAFAIVGLLEDASTRFAGVVFAAVAIIAAIWGHAVFYLPRQSTNSAEVLEAAEYIRTATPDDSVIICLSNDWSPLVSYYARRRALNLPMDGEGKMPRELVADALARLKGEKIGAVVLVEPVLYPVDVAKEQLRDAGIDVPFLNVKGLPKF